MYSLRHSVYSQNYCNTCRKERGLGNLARDGQFLPNACQFDWLSSDRTGRVVSCWLSCWLFGSSVRENILFETSVPCASSVCLVASFFFLLFPLKNVIRSVVVEVSQSVFEHPSAVVNHHRQDFKYLYHCLLLKNVCYFKLVLFLLSISIFIALHAAPRVY